MKKIVRNVTMIVFIIILMISTFVFFRVIKYKMTEDEKIVYNAAIKEYESIQSELRDLSDQLFCSGKYQDQKALLYKEVDGYERLYNDRYFKIRAKHNNTIQQLFEIKFPTKYQGMYQQLVLLKYIDSVSSGMASESIDFILDVQKDYFPDNSIGRRVDKLKKQLYNEYYVPTEIDNDMYEQMYYRITTDWYNETKITSRSDYLELHELLYHEEFLESLKENYILSLEEIKIIVGFILVFIVYILFCIIRADKKIARKILKGRTKVSK